MLDKRYWFSNINLGHPHKNYLLFVLTVLLINYQLSLRLKNKKIKLEGQTKSDSILLETHIDSLCY